MLILNCRGRGPTPSVPAKSCRRSQGRAAATVGVRLAQLVERRIGIAREPRKLIEEGKLAGIQLLVRARLDSPDVPRQHLDLVQRCQIANEAAGNEPQSVQLREGDAEPLGVGYTVPALLPGVSGD